jgi:hypothetical protein
MYSPGLSSNQSYGIEQSDFYNAGYFANPSAWSSQENTAASPNDISSFLQWDVAASSTSSYPPSQFDGESFIQSPVSPTFSSAMSVASNAMSPDASTPSTQELSEEAQEQAESDSILEALLADIEATMDGKYRCVDVNSDVHSCGFVAERKCMLRKHLESTLKTNVCRQGDCNMHFSSKAVLTRHEKETHGMHQALHYFCPVETCDRHNRGFPREYNRADHISRVHRELDPKAYTKCAKRTSKKTGSSSSINAVKPTGVRKSSSPKTRRERLEKQYRASREKLGTYFVRLPDNGADATKYILQLETEVAKLKEASMGLQILVTSND